MALDLPGFGRSPAADVEPVALLQEVIAALFERPPVVLTPSMSGRFALPLVVTAPQSVAGLVAVAPVGIAQFVAAERPADLPALLLWGELDTVVPVSEGRKLEAVLAGSRMVVLEGARHPCYLDRPEQFHEELLRFLGGL